MNPTGARRGFTLIEVMIVAALIALLSGIALFSIQQFYDSNVRKAALGECNRLGTALEFANQNLGFYPKLNYLRQPRSVVQFNETTGVADAAYVVHALDYYGYFPGGTASPALGRVALSWDGPYYGASVNRARSNRGTQSGITKVRLADVFYATNSLPLSLVSWPADPYGNPYVLYQVKYDSSGTYSPVVVGSPGQSADYFNAVVSYGPNKFPGGNENTPDTPAGASVRDALRGAALYLVGDPLGDGQANYTMKSASPLVTDTNYRVILSTLDAGWASFRDSIKWDPAAYAGQNQQNLGYVGIRDNGSDDLSFEF